jgi:hypothetical protein
MPKYLDSQKYYECVLVSAINASIYYGKKAISQDSQEYEFLVDLSKSRYGSAIEIDKVYEYLGLRRVKMELSWKNIIRNIDRKLIEVSVWHLSVGYHAVLIIGYKWFRNLRVLNFSIETKDQWISWFKLRKYFRVYSDLFIIEKED